MLASSRHDQERSRDTKLIDALQTYRFKTTGNRWYTTAATCGLTPKKGGAELLIV